MWLSFSLCGDNQVWQFLPTWVRTAHTGSTEGNSSIGIERLVNVDTDFDKAIDNQAKLYRYSYESV